MLCALIKAGSFKEKDLLGRCWPGSDKIDVMGNRTCGGRAAKRAIFEMTVRCRMVMGMVRKTLRRVCPGAWFQQKRRTGRRHEADRDIGAKQQRRQQQAAE